MRLRPIALLALALSACSSEPAAKPPEPKPTIAVTPVVSDGVNPFENKDLGIRAWFPRGDQVCPARSRDAAFGFYARYGTTDTGCPEARGKAAFMGISATFNAEGYRSVKEVVGLCQPLPQAMIRRFGGTAPAFPGHESIVCVDTTGESIMIMVNAVAGETDGMSHFVYSAALATHPERFDRDAAMFRAFLQKLQIGTATRR